MCESKIQELKEYLEQLRQINARITVSYEHFTEATYEALDQYQKGYPSDRAISTNNGHG